MADETEITEEEFEQWLSPKGVGDLLEGHLHNSTWRQLLLKRIEDEDAHVAARKAIYRQGSQENPPRHRERLPRSYWREARPSTIDSFWSSGDITLRIPATSSYSLATLISCVDVRFEPEGVRRLIPSVSRWKLVPADAPIAPAIAQAPKVDRGAPVAPAEIDAWYDAQTLDIQALSVRKLWVRAKADLGTDFPRKLVDRFGKDRSTGPRRATGPIAPN